MSYRIEPLMSLLADGCFLHTTAPDETECTLLGGILKHIETLDRNICIWLNLI